MNTKRVIEFPGDGSGAGRGGVGPDRGAGSFRLHLEFGPLPAGVESERDRRRLVLILNHPDYPGFQRQIVDVGGCADPIRISVARLRELAGSGGLGQVLSGWDPPFGVMLLRCMNRRASRCPSCARVYQGDTYQLVRAGIAGGKGVPVSVASNPQVFATLTAPSFGAVHRAADPDEPGAVCKRRYPALCPHGRERGCRERHGPGDALVGQALCPQCYDYPRQVVWNARASKLCKGLMDNLYHHLARHAGVSRGEIRGLVRVEYARVAEYQARGAVHFHILFRLDGPEGPGSPAPAWASPEVLIEALASARRASTVRVPDGFGGEWRLKFGGQPERIGEPVVLDGEGYTARKVASYLAKYVSKGTEDAYGADLPVRRLPDIEDLGKTPHVRSLMRAAWRLGGVEAYAQMGLRRWCHMLGYGGHVLTASRGYSVTRTALRAARAQFRGGQAPEATADAVGVIERSLFSFAGRGYGSRALEELAEDVREDMELNRQTAQDALDLSRERGDAA
jgi:hypothetical protein